MDRRAIFFAVAGAVSALLAIPLDDELQWVPLALAGLYAVLALASFLDHWSQQHGADDPGPTPP
jgi:hypothetical protein